MHIDKVHELVRFGLQIEHRQTERLLVAYFCLLDSSVAETVDGLMERKHVVFVDERLKGVIGLVPRARLRAMRDRKHAVFLVYPCRDLRLDAAWIVHQIVSVHLLRDAKALYLVVRPKS